MVRVLVTGGVDYTDADWLEHILDAAIIRLGLTEIVQGEAPGADFLAKQWAIKRGIPHLDFPADWRAFGQLAGRVRNKEMLELAKPELVIAFAGHEGTLHMKTIAVQANIRVIEIGER